MRAHRPRFDEAPTQPLDPERARQAAELVKAAIRAERQRRNARRWRWVILLANFWLSAWLLMLAVGVARARWLTDLPTVSFGTTCWLLFLVSTAIGVLVAGRQIADILSGREE